MIQTLSCQPDNYSMAAESNQGCRICKIMKTKMMRCTQCSDVYYCSRPCQIKDWPAHKIVCTQDSEKSTSVDARDTEDEGQVSTNEKPHHKNSQCEEKKQDDDRDNISDKKFTIIVKCKKDKIKVNVSDRWSGSEILSNISVVIKVREMKLIHKGRIMNADNIKEFLKEKALFQAIGEPSESEEGLVSSDVDCIVAQAKVDRNEAVRALRRTGDVVDAILYISNK